MNKLFFKISLRERLKKWENETIFKISLRARFKISLQAGLKKSEIEHF